MGSSGVSSGTRFNQHKHRLNNDKGHQTRLSKFYKSNKNSIAEIKWSILREIKEYVPNKRDDCSICNLEWLVLKWVRKNTKLKT